MNRTTTFTLLAVLLLTMLEDCPAHAQQLSPPEQLIERYSAIRLDTALADDQREQSLKQLLAEAEQYRDANTNDANAWIASARIRAGYASQTTSLSLAKETKAELEKAIALDSTAQGGMAQAYLGRLYMDLPGWPLSFGDDDKGEQLIEAAMAIDSSTSANNFFYAQYLVSKKRYGEARDYLQKAERANSMDSAHPRWQQIQQQNIAWLLETIEGRP